MQEKSDRQFYDLGNKINKQKEYLTKVTEVFKEDRNRKSGDKELNTRDKE